MPLFMNCTWSHYFSTDEILQEKNSIRFKDRISNRKCFAKQTSFNNKKSDLIIICITLTLKVRLPRHFAKHVTQILNISLDEVANSIHNEVFVLGTNP